MLQLFVRVAVCMCLCIHVIDYRPNSIDKLTAEHIESTTAFQLNKYWCTLWLHPNKLILRRKWNETINTVDRRLNGSESGIWVFGFMFLPTFETLFNRISFHRTSDTQQSTNAFVSFRPNCGELKNFIFSKRHQWQCPRVNKWKLSKTPYEKCVCVWK